MALNALKKKIRFCWRVTREIEALAGSDLRRSDRI
jgi:hypothetical protein